MCDIENETAPAPDAAKPRRPNRTAVHDRRVARAEDLSADQIAAIAASEMAPGLEHLNILLGEA